jgi:hypothetical protein
MNGTEVVRAVFLILRMKIWSKNRGRVDIMLCVLLGLGIETR